MVEILRQERRVVRRNVASPTPDGRDRSARQMKPQGDKPEPSAAAGLLPATRPRRERGRAGHHRVAAQFFFLQAVNLKF
jgi:hypothetical protein